MILALATLWPQPSLAQSRSQLGPLCTTDGTPADAQIDACNKIIALKAFSGPAARHHLFLARSRLEQERQLYAGDHRTLQRRSGLLPNSWALLPTCAAPPITTEASTISRYRGLQRCAADGSAEWDRVSQSRQRLARQGRIHQGDRGLRRLDQNQIRSHRSPGRTAASRGRRSAISTARFADINEAIRLGPGIAVSL